MAAQEWLGFWTRLWLAIVLFWKILFDGRLAARVRLTVWPEPAEPVERAEAAEGTERAERAELKPSQAESRSLSAVTAAGVELKPALEAASALQVLAILQREGRFIDFLEEDIAAFSDAEVGAAARVVHEGCKRGFAEYIAVEPLRREPEGAPVLLEPGFDPARARITGNVVGEPPFRGRLAHHGWQVTNIRLPRLAAGHDPRVLAPAEVEL